MDLILMDNIRPDSLLISINNLIVKRILITIASLVVLAGCKERYAEPRSSGWSTSAVFYKNWAVDSVHRADGRLGFSVHPNGGNTVFVWSRNSGENDNIWDNEYSGSLYIQVDSAASSFSYTNEEMPQHFTIYRGVGAWSGYGDTLVTKGHISGTKLSEDRWNLDIDVTLPSKDDISGLEHIVNNSVFTYKEMP